MADDIFTALFPPVNWKIEGLKLVYDGEERIPIKHILSIFEYIYDRFKDAKIKIERDGNQLCIWILP